MALGSVAGFWAVSMLLVLTPGADWAYAIAAGLRQRSVVPAVGGLLAGYVVHTVIVAAGVAAIVAGSPSILTALTAVGATYLVALGALSWRRPTDPHADDAPSENSPLRQAAKGAGISGLNPKALLLFLALLPQFTDERSGWPVAAQLVALGVVHIANCAVVYTGVAIGAQAVLRARPAAARTVTRLSGAAMVLIGIVLLAERLTPGQA